MLPFGAGKRVCPGETLAKNRLSLIVTTLLQKFSFLPVEGDPPLPTDPRKYDMGAILEPTPYRIRVVPRT